MFGAPGCTSCGLAQSVTSSHTRSEMPRCATVFNPFALRPSSENTAFILGCMPVSPGNWVMNVSYVGRVARVFRVIALPNHPAGATLRRCFHRKARLAMTLYVLCP